MELKYGTCHQWRRFVFNIGGGEQFLLLDTFSLNSLPIHLLPSRVFFYSSNSGGHSLIPFLPPALDAHTSQAVLFYILCCRSASDFYGTRNVVSGKRFRREKLLKNHEFVRQKIMKRMITTKLRHQRSSWAEIVWTSPAQSLFGPAVFSN